MTPDDLLRLHSEAFKSIVNNDIRGESDDETARSLRSPLVMERWYNSLVATKRSIETQFATFKIERLQKQASSEKANDARIYDDFMEEKNKWRVGALRFKSSVEEKIAEAKTFIRQERTDVLAVRQAILDHKTRCINDPDHAEDWDEELWNSLV